MKRWARRILAVLLGLCLGWYVAGFAPAWLPGLEVSLAGEAEYGRQDHAPSDADAPEVHKGDDVRGAEQLVPNAWDKRMIKPVIGIAAGLFAAAVLAGLMCRYVGILDPNVQATVDDQSAAGTQGDDHEESHEQLSDHGIGDEQSSSG